MTTRRRALGASAFALVLAACSNLPWGNPPAPAVTMLPSEGMWLFNQAPVERIEKQFGFHPSQQWLDHLRLSCVRIGASGAFVSPDGLILTNHHVAAGGLQNASSAGKDYVTDGFLAKTRDEELKLPGLELSVLEEIVDVTARVNAGVDPKLTGEAAVKARHAVFATVEHESEQQTGLQSSIVTLYGGALYNLYRYKRYTDIRAVFAPEFAVAFFGGDPDNYEYPRYDLDITLLRAYENGQPAHVRNYLKFSSEGVHDGELIFIAGNPGTTDRLQPVAALEAMRTITLPLSVGDLESREHALLEYSARGPEQARQAQRDIFGVQNSLKAMRPRLAAIDNLLLARRRQEETALRTQLRARPDLAQYDRAWDDIARAEQRRAALLVPYRFLEGGSTSALFGHARALVRIPSEDARPDAQRLPEYTQARRAQLQHRLLSDVPIYPELEIAKLSEFLRFYRDQLGGQSPLLRQALAGKSPDERARELVGGSRLADAAERKRLLDGGGAAIAADSDAMIQFAVSIDAESRRLRLQYEAEVDEPITQALTQINRARFAIYGSSLYPDATGTLRLAFGAVKGYPQDGQQIPPWTNLGGAFTHEQKHGGAAPFALPASWHAAQSRLALQTPINFVSTADITNGNSGSPVVNAKGELVGILFDSNRQGIPNNLAFTDAQARAVSVDSRGILETLRKVYHADGLVAELLGQNAAAQ